MHERILLPERDNSSTVVINCRNQAITLIDPRPAPEKGVLSVMGILRQLTGDAACASSRNQRFTRPTLSILAVLAAPAVF